MDDTQPKKSNTLKIVVTVVVLALIGYGAFKYMKRDSVALVGDEMPVPGTKTEEIVASRYKDGTYSATGSYTSPGGAEEIGVTLTLKDDVVVSASVEKRATRPGSVAMQTAFEGGFATLVVGKKIDEVNLDKVSGSSLTPKGWNDAVAKIKVQAGV